MSDDEMIRRGDALAALARYRAHTWAASRDVSVQDPIAAIAALPAVRVRYTKADIGKIAAIIAEDDPFGVGAAAIAKAGRILAALDPAAHGGDA